MTMLDNLLMPEPPDGVVRAHALDHAVSMWCEGETQDDVIARAQAFYNFMVAGRLRATGMAKSPTAVN